MRCPSTFIHRDHQNLGLKHSDHIKGKYNNLIKHIWLIVQKGAQDVKSMSINSEGVLKLHVLAVICTFIGSACNKILNTITLTS